jgi:hypothetical protein
MPFVKLNWKPTPKQLRQFGVVFLTGFVVMGLAKYFWPFSWGISQDKNVGFYSMLIGLIGGGIALTGTRLALPLYYLWMGIAFIIGNIMSRVIMVIIYYGVITPLALIGRLVGRDRLQLRKTETGSYWHDISLPKEPEKYERQF